MPADFVRARNEALDTETVLPASALPYLAGWTRIEDDPAPATPGPAGEVATPTDEPDAGGDAAPAAEPATPGSTPVGRPTRKPKES
jgi:hypothetical protein